MIYTVIAAIAFVLGLWHMKWFLNWSRVEYRAFLAVQFTLLFFLTAFFVPWHGTVDARFFEPRNIFLFLFTVALGVIYNSFFTRGLRRESLHEYEMIDLLLPVFTIGLAAVIFVDEREPMRLSLALLAAGAFLLAHLKKSHLRFTQADRWLVFAVFLMASELLLFKVLLELASPVGLYALRTGAIALVFIFLAKPHFWRIRPIFMANIAVNAALGLLYKLLVLVAITKVGIVVTELYLLIGPLLLAFLTGILLRERWSWRQGIAFLVILASIILVHLVL